MKHREPPPSDLGPQGPAAAARPRDDTLDPRSHKPIRRRYTVECVLDWYHSRGLITELEHAAGIRFRAIWSRAVRLRMASQRLDGTPRATHDAHQAALAAERAHRDLTAALDHLHHTQAKLVEAVCGYNHLVTDVAGLAPTPRPTRQLGDALHTLAIWWRLTV